MQQLTTNSNEATLKMYFGKVRELHASGEQFPTELDEVWPLVYSTKQNAFTELKKNFFEGDDFNLMQNHKVIKATEIQTGVKYECKLSVSCLEYFIVRKVRAVFEVYRSVFHAVATPKTDLEVLSDAVLIANRVIAEKEAQIKVLTPKAEYTDKVLQSETTMTATEVAKSLGLSAARLNEMLCDRGIQYKHRKHYVLSAKYQNKGYAKLVPPLK